MIFSKRRRVWQLKEGVSVDLDRQHGYSPNAYNRHLRCKVKSNGYDRDAGWLCYRQKKSTHSNGWCFLLVLTPPSYSPLGYYTRWQQQPYVRDVHAWQARKRISCSVGEVQSTNFPYLRERGRLGGSRTQHVANKFIADTHSQPADYGYWQDEGLVLRKAWLFSWLWYPVWWRRGSPLVHNSSWGQLQGKYFLLSASW